ncbi:MAG: glycosyltransferase family 2 protein [Clostridiaceae bacterium]|nr:glycosyltransferase family 2 protein [Clostridiaceae bacterium]
MIKDFVNILLLIFQIFFLLIGLYYFATSVFGLAEKIYGKVSRNYLPIKRFAVFIPAHNEEIVIENIVDNLKQLNYPKDSYDVYVIADNCTDNTAAAAKAAGANVLERTDDNRRGKGYALQWAFEKILYDEDSEYDAAVIFDADNLVSKNFLKEMNNKLCDGQKVIQGYIDSKNPDDSWITASYSIAFWSSNRLFQCARSFLGMSCEIGGTGFCMDVGVLKQIGWNATCLVEDLEFTMKLMLNNIKVAWAHEAIVYDEKPLTLAQSWRQRRRWMQGFADVCSRYFVRLFKKGIRDRNAALIDCALYTLQPYVLLTGGIMLLLPLINTYIMDYDLYIISARIIPEFFKLYGIVQLILVPLCLFYDGKLSRRLMLFYPVYILYCFTWIPIAIEGIIMMKNKEWNHTMHTRKVTIRELE